MITATLVKQVQHEGIQELARRVSVAFADTATLAVPRSLLTRLQAACRARGVAVSQVVEGALAVAADNLEWVTDEAQAVGA